MAVTAQAREVAQVKRYARVVYVGRREVHDVVDDDGRRHATKLEATLAQMMVTFECLFTYVLPCLGMVEAVGKLT